MVAAWTLTLYCSMIFLVEVSPSKCIAASFPNPAGCWLSCPASVLCPHCPCGRHARRWGINNAMQHFLLKFYSHNERADEPAGILLLLYLPSHSMYTVCKEIQCINSFFCTGLLRHIRSRDHLVVQNMEGTSCHWRGRTRTWRSWTGFVRPLCHSTWIPVTLNWTWK